MEEAPLITPLFLRLHNLPKPDFNSLTADRRRLTAKLDGLLAAVGGPRSAVCPHTPME